MSEKYKERVTVVYQSCIAAGVYSIWLQTAQIAAAAVPGQFVSVYSNNASRILPNPISICEINKNSGMIRLVYRVVGEGTEEFSHLVPGDSVDVRVGAGLGQWLFPTGEVRTAHRRRHRYSADAGAGKAVGRGEDGGAGYKTNFPERRI